MESIAIDPKDPDTIYAGTWHLPWKTTDDGANWHNIKQGLIDDSDVFSIIIDPTVPQRGLHQRLFRDLQERARGASFTTRSRAFR